MMNTSLPTSLPFCARLMLVLSLSLLGLLPSCVGLFKTQNNEQKLATQDGQTRTVASTTQGSSATKFSFAYKSLDLGDYVRVYLELDIQRLSLVPNADILTQEFEFRYGLLADYQSQEYLTTGQILPTADNIQKKGGLFYLYFNLPKMSQITSSAILLLEVTDKKTGQRVLQDIPLSFVASKLRDSFAPFNKKGDLPHFSNYFQVNDTVRIRDIKGSPKELLVKYYNDDFPVAATPMALAGGAINKTFNFSPDSTFTIVSNSPISLYKSGTYWIVENDADFSGLTLRVYDQKFPKYSFVPDLIEPLIYITTQEELQNLKVVKDTASIESLKIALDKFWLRLSENDKEKARATIKDYYSRVKLANMYFSTFKEGWKTDMGMIFVIFGSPDKVRRFQDKEVWTYTQLSEFSEINFTFVRKNSQFSDRDFELIRYSEYEAIWYDAIEAWREGRGAK